ncbi:R3H domain-containing protein 4 [Quillaja saponaria]|uniref:R3H domain-containing protein 4 n=1 Tax=Quillaja saponaria TaxID=32244 RepID=A0AAD7VEG2_QUISA|nr:R3H domain-containing protein 4 [Quillaja saponaria]
MFVPLLCHESCLMERRLENKRSASVLNIMVSNRRSRRWLNDRLLMELVPRLNAEEIRGLFAPPLWGDDVPPSPFCMTNVGECDKNVCATPLQKTQMKIFLLRIQDPFHRLLLHGVCEFYNLVSVTVTDSNDGGPSKMTRIKKRKRGYAELPNITLAHFLKMSKEGI